MAKTVGDLLIKLGVDGIEGVNVLKSSLTALGKAAGPTDKNIRKIRTEILEFANAGQKSTQAIRGVIESFKGLQAQASINSSVYKQLAADIEGLESTLTSLIPDANKAATAMERLSTIGFPSRVPDAFEKNMKVRRQQLQGLRVDSEDYLNTLVGIRNFEAQQAARVARQEVSAAARVARTGMPSSIVQADQPTTIAALRLRIGEVQNEIENLDFTTQDYAEANKELIALQKSLSQALNGTSSSFDSLGEAQTRAARRAEKLANIQQYYGTSRTGEGQAAQRAGGFRDPATGAIIARGTRAGRVSLAQQPMREISGLYRSIGDIGMSGISADIDRMGKSYQEVARDIKAATAASNGSINSLQAQRSAFAQLRAGLDPTSQDFRELGKEIEKVDRRLEKLNKRRRRPTIGGIAQGLGGIAAGGVFGGPEGAIGAAVGGAMGGVAGVAAGAALGAQAKMMREALGATSDYAAQLQKLEIALEGVTQVTDKFGNVDSASSLGNYQLGIKAAADVTRDFNIPLDVSTKGITRLAAAVIGAGGNIGDAEVVFRNITSAIKATGGGAQDVESAITAMVQTFSKGKVSAEELSGQLGERLPGAVTQFAEANKMTLPELQKAFKAGTVGLDQLMKFIISLGPEYEETARAIADSSADAGARAAVAFDQVRREIGEALQPIGAQLQKAFSKFVLDILPAIKGAAVAAANGLNLLLNATSVLIKNFKEFAIVAGVAGVALALQNLVGIAAALGTAFGKATVAMKGFTAASLLNPWVALAAGITAATVALVKHTKKNAEFNKSVIAGETTNEEANDRLREMNDKVQELEDRLGKETNNRMIQALTRQLKAAKIAAGDLELAMKLASSYEVAGIKYDRMTGRPINAPTSYTPHDYDDPDADPASGDAPMSMVELTLRRQMRDALEKENKVRESILQMKLDLLAASEEEEGSLKRTNMEEQARHEHALRMNQINEEGLAIFDKQLEQRQQLERTLRDAQIAAAGLTEEEKKRININRQLAEFAEKAVEAGLSSEKIVKMLRELRKALEDAKDSAGSFSETFKSGLEEMINVGPKLANVALKAISGVADGLVDMIATGQANFRKFAAEILKDIAKIMMRAALAKAVKSIFNLSADGNVIQSGQIKPYAKGGIVAAPTLFPMKGNNIGVMGEAGPEAILPLRRGPDGRLGVENTGASRMNAAMSRYSRNGVAPGQMTDADGMPVAGGMGGGSAALDVRYNVERINNVDYVTAAEFEQGMTQAAKRGAELGRRNVYSDLVNKRSIRSRVAL